jgi:hypothetical protein
MSELHEMTVQEAYADGAHIEHDQYLVYTDIYRRAYVVLHIEPANAEAFEVWFGNGNKDYLRADETLDVMPKRERT